MLYANAFNLDQPKILFCGKQFSEAFGLTCYQKKKNQQIFELSKLSKVFADDKFSMAQIWGNLSQV